MKVLVTGGEGRLAQKLKSDSGIEYLLPPKSKLDLQNYSSIDTYLQRNKNIEGIILNAIKYVPDFNNTVAEESNFSKSEYNKLRDQSIEGLEINLLPIVQFMATLKNQLKFVILLTTGLNVKLDNNHILYRNSKNAMQDLIYRIIHTEGYESIKAISLHPGHMHDEYTYSTTAKQITAVLKNIHKLESCCTYALYDKTNMYVEKIVDQTTLERIQL